MSEPTQDSLTYWMDRVRSGQATPEELTRLSAMFSRERPSWTPLPGPQTVAHDSAADEVYFGGAAGGGKALAVDTPVLTTRGWTTQGQLRVGDCVYHPSGQPTRVVALSRVETPGHVYRLTLSDGSQVIADALHRWRITGRAETLDSQHICAGMTIDTALSLAIPASDANSYLSRLTPRDAHRIGADLARPGSTLSIPSGLTCLGAETRAALLAGLGGESDTGHNRHYRTQTHTDSSMRPDYQCETGEGGDTAGGGRCTDLGAAAPLAPTKIHKSSPPGSAYRVARIEREDVAALAVELARGLGYESSRELVEVKRPYWLAWWQRSGSRQITKVEKITGVPVRCIQVEAGDGMYLCGGGLIPTHNSDLLLGLAATKHRRSLILRQTFPTLEYLIERARELFVRTKLADYNAQEHILRFRDGRLVRFGSMEHESDWERYAGQPYDFLGYDEVPQVMQKQYRSLLGWNRTTEKGQRCRVVGAGNPPRNSDQRWVMSEFAPWLDRKFHDPAKPGELRWYVMDDDGSIRWLKSAAKVKVKGHFVKPMSRTFIPASMRDNPHLATTGYADKLYSMEEPLRSILLGDFYKGISDDEWQCIPTLWVEQAMARWTPNKPAMATLSAIGADVARGGADKTVVSQRFGVWFAPLVKVQGEATDTGQKAGKIVHGLWQPGARVNVDVIGVGASAYDWLNEKIGDLVSPIDVRHRSELFNKSRTCRLVNVGTAMYWLLREALDPETGLDLQLPPDQELLADLCSYRYEPRADGYILEDKERVKKRLKRSPDTSDALALAWWQQASGVGSIGLSRPREEEFGLGPPHLQETGDDDEEWLAYKKWARGETNEYDEA